MPSSDQVSRKSGRLLWQVGKPLLVQSTFIGFVNVAALADLDVHVAVSVS